MPRWAVAVLAALAVLAIAAIVLQGAVIFNLITDQHRVQMQVCHLYRLQHPLRVIPPGCRP